MTKVVYTGDAEHFRWKQLSPVNTARELMRHRDLIVTLTIRDFRAAYQASYLGVAWQLAVPLIMLTIFYTVFGRLLGGRFSNGPTETPLEYALALFVGLGFFNFLAQNISSAPTLISSNTSYVKTLSFPLEVLPVTTVLNALLNQVIGLALATLVLLLVKGHVYLSAICIPFYVLCSFLIALGVTWFLSALAVFIRDVSAVTSPLTLILMFMCPIFYPASLVPKNIKWVVDVNPLAVIIEDARASLLYGRWPSPLSALAILLVSMLFASFGYFIFIRAKPAFADVL